MRTVRTGALIGVVFAGAFTAFNAVNCASATTITLEVRADGDVCGAVTETGIAVMPATKILQVESYPLQDFQKSCKEGRVGTLVITPSSEDARSSRIGIRVVAGLNGNTASQCDDLEGNALENCIITKREVTFVEGANVPVTVTLSANCVGVTCKNDEECDPDRPRGRNCVPRENFDPARKKGNEDLDSGSAPIDTGVKQDVFVEAAPPTLKQICEEAPGAFNAGVDGGASCTIDCANVDCKKGNACPPGMDCIFLCNKANACSDINCAATGQCTISCDGTNGNPQCANVSCDAGACYVKCAGSENNCNGVTLAGRNNKIECVKADGKVTCDKVKCLAGSATCERSCDGPIPNACGPTASCDAGDCTKFEAGAP